MRRKSFDGIPCGIARTVNVLGDAWTFVIIREALFGISAFDEFIDRLDIPRNTLASRLDGLVKNGLMTKRQDDVDKRRSVYALEAAGRDLWVVMLALQQWGNKWQFAEEGPPSFMADRETRQPVETLTVKGAEGQNLSLNDVTMIAGGSATSALKSRFDALS